MWKKERDAFSLFEDFLQECEGKVVVLNGKDKIRFIDKDRDMCYLEDVFVF